MTWKKITSMEDPNEIVASLAGAWNEWNKAKIWEKPSSELAGIRGLKIPENFDTKSQFKGTGQVAARWQRSHIDINPKSWDEEHPDTRKWLLAHELSHAAAADFLSHNPDKHSLLKPYARGEGIRATYSESHLHMNPDEVDSFARTPEEMLSDIGATLLISGENVIEKNAKSFGISPNSSELALYKAMAQHLRRVGNPSTPIE